MFYLAGSLNRKGNDGQEMTLNRPRLLNGCAKSKFIADAFEAKEWDAWTCDLLPPEGPGNHIQDDVLKHLNDGWDMAIFHPECTYIANSGVHWLHRRPERWELMRLAALFFKQLWEANIPLISIENPIPHHYAVDIIGKNYDQIIQPNQFGEDASKATCLWLKGLPKLLSTKQVEPHLSITGKKIWGNQTMSGQNKLAPSDHRKADRSRTYKEIAEAMAQQWGTLRKH